ERALDDEVAHGLIERELHALEPAVQRQPDERQRERCAQPPRPRGAQRRDRGAFAAAFDPAAIRPATEHQRSPPTGSASGSPITRTSSSSSTPLARRTPSRTSAMSPSMSAAVALATFKMKFACLSETIAPPRFKPFKPARSMSRPAKSPGGLRNTEPQLGVPSGCAALRRASSSLIASIELDASCSKRN